MAAPTKAIRLAAEQAMQDSGLRYTILRPTMIYGSRRDRNICRLIRYLRRFPVVPVFGPGTALQQPVHLTDVARAVVDAFEAPGTERRCYNLPGATALTYNELIDTVAAALGKRVWRLHVPVGLGLLLARAWSRLGLGRAVTGEQVLRLQEDKAFDYAEAAADFGYSPLSFGEGVSRQVELEFGVPGAGQRAVQQALVSGRSRRSGLRR